MRVVVLRDMFHAYATQQTKHHLLFVALLIYCVPRPDHKLRLKATTYRSLFHPDSGWWRLVAPREVLWRAENCHEFWGRGGSALVVLREHSITWSTNSTKLGWTAFKSRSTFAHILISCETVPFNTGCRLYEKHDRVCADWTMTLLGRPKLIHVANPEHVCGESRVRTIKAIIFTMFPATMTLQTQQSVNSQYCTPATTSLTQSKGSLHHVDQI